MTKGEAAAQQALSLIEATAVRAQEQPGEMGVLLTALQEIVFYARAGRAQRMPSALMRYRERVRGDAVLCGLIDAIMEDLA